MNASQAIPLTPLRGTAEQPATQTAHHGSAADDTAALTRAAARGDTAAFGTIYERWFGRALAAAQHLTGRDEAFCLDVVQDAMLRAARKLPPLPDEAALGAWLCRVVHRAALDRLRAERRRRTREAGRDQHSPTAAPTDTLDDDIVWLRARLRELPPDDGWLLGARFVRERTLEQAGSPIGLTGDAAHGRIRRVLRRLARLSPEHQTPPTTDQGRPQDRTP